MFTFLSSLFTNFVKSICLTISGHICCQLWSTLGCFWQAWLWNLPPSNWQDWQIRKTWISYQFSGFRRHFENFTSNRNSLWQTHSKVGCWRRGWNWENSKELRKKSATKLRERPLFKNDVFLCFFMWISTEELLCFPNKCIKQALI